MEFFIRRVFDINIFRKITMMLRTSVRFIILIIISAFLIAGGIVLFYNPTYAVNLNGEIIGYTADKTGLQEKINEFISAKEKDNVAFVQVDAMPTYKLCLLKKDVETNDEEIFNKVVNNGTEYYKYYAITLDKEEKLYVSSFKEAEDVINGLKKKDSNNKDKIGIVEKYDTELKEFTNVETSISKLYEKKPEPKVEYSTSSYYSSGTPSYSSGSSSSNISIGIALIKPVSGTITSRFGSNESIRNHAHSGLDIAAPYGTAIKAAASGTVTFAGNAGDGYGNYVIISHGNGVQTVYAHCSSVLVTSGQKVTQGEVIAKVGSTGNSTGNHLHLEVRKNGVAYDPQNYVY